MAITRANPYLGEIVEDLNMHLQKYNGDVVKARENLPKADSEWIDEELLHCLTDSRYFLSNYYAYRDEKEGYKGLYPFFDSQEILHEEYEKLVKAYGRVRSLVHKARQMGSTTYHCGRIFHATVLFEHRGALLVGKDDKQKNKMFGMYSSALDFLPWWMKPRIKSFQTGEVIDFDERDEALRAIRPGLKTIVTWEQANKPSGAGRGDTFNCELLSELAHWMDGGQLSKSIFPTMNTPDGLYFMESTPNGRNDFWHNLWRRAEAGKIDWHPIYIPFYLREKTYSLPILKTEVFIVTDEERLMRESILKKEGHLIKDETFKWMRAKKEEFIATDGDDMMFSQEYSSDAEDAFQTGAITAFPRGIINRYSKLTMNPLEMGEINYDFELGRPKLNLKPVHPSALIPYPELENRFHVWERPIKGEKYAMGIDVSLGNQGGDYSCIQVIKMSSGHELDEQVACWHGLIDPEGLAEYVFAIGWWYNEALAAVEVNSMGMVTNNYLVRQLEYENIYRFKRLDRLKHFITDIVGWWTDEKSKRALLSKMAKALRDDQIKIRCRFTVDEFRDFTEDGAEGDGAHDDFTMAILIALYCGHEGEFNERQTKKKEEREDANTFTVKFRDGITIIATTTSQNEAERVAKRHPGSTIERKSGATATLEVAGKKFKVPSDFQNTEFSPIHDKEGIAHRLHYEEGIPEEDITPEMMQDFEDEQEALENSEDSWKYV